MSALLIKNGRLIDPARNIDEYLDVLIEGQRVREVGRDIKPLPEDLIEIDAANLIVTPGFIDLHTHLREPGNTESETIANGTQAAAKGGFTTICAMPNTKPPIDSTATMEQLSNLIQKYASIRVLPIAAITEGLKGEKVAPLRALAKLGAVAFSDDGMIVQSAAVMRSAATVASEIGRPLINHAEDQQLVNHGVANEGAVSSRLGLRPNPAIAEAVMVARDINIAELTGAQIHIPHISTAAALRYVAEAKRRGLAVTAEVTPHHLLLTDQRLLGSEQDDARVTLSAYDTNTRVNPPLRDETDRQALINALSDGTIDVVATDHAPHHISYKETFFEDANPGISGLETAFGLMMKLVQQKQLTITRLIDSLTARPAAILGQAAVGLGTLAPGSFADVTILDINKEWKVDKTEFVSLGQNTPFDGEPLTGKPSMTIHKGKTVYAYNGMSNNES